MDEYTGLVDVANFVTLLATYMEGFNVIMEPQGTLMTGVTEPLLQLCCLDSSIAIRPVMTYFKVAMFGVCPVCVRVCVGEYVCMCVCVYGSVCWCSHIVSELYR
jgi:hypothetical protein